MQPCFNTAAWAALLLLVQALLGSAELAPLRLRAQRVAPHAPPHAPGTAQGGDLSLVEQEADAGLDATASLVSKDDVEDIDDDDDDDLDDDDDDDDDTTAEERAASADIDLANVERSLAAMSGKKATPGMIKFVNTVKGMIKDDMKPKILDAHKKAQDLLNSYKDGFAKCLKGKATAASTMKTLEGTKVKSSDDHKQCRKLEEAAYKERDTCEDLLDAKEETKKAACDALADLNKNPAAEADNCHAAHRESFGDWLDRNEHWFVNKNKEFKSQKGKCDSAAKEYDTLKPQCDKKAQGHVGKKAECDLKQKELETSACNLGKGLWSSCNTYTACHDDTEETYKKEKPAIKKDEKDRKGEWRVLMRVGCLLDVFADEDGEVDSELIGTCKNKTHDTTHLDLTYPAIPAKQACPELPAVPGQSTFKAAEYDSLPEDAKAQPTAMCVVQAGGGIALGAPKGVPPANCVMDGEFLKAGAAGSCLLSDTDGEPVTVDYTKNRLTKFEFTMKFAGNPGNYNRRPVGGFMPCNVDGKSYRRGRTTELNFYDIRGYWGYTMVYHPHTYRYYQNKNDKKIYKEMPDSQKELKWEIVMEYRSNRRLYVYSWAVNGVQLTSYNNRITNCPSNGNNFGFTPRVWAWGATKGVYISDFKVYQGLMPFDMPQIIGTGVPQTTPSVPCAEKGKIYSGPGIPGYGRYRTMNVVNCQKRCLYLSGCVKFTYLPDGWCYYYGEGAKARNGPEGAVSGPPTCEDPPTQGLRAEFFFYKERLNRLPNLLHMRPDQERHDNVIWYSSTGSFHPGVKNRDLVAARWTGSILITKPGEYKFDTRSDDGSFLWIDGKLCVANGGLHGMRTAYGTRYLKAGFHDIMVTFFENYGGFGIQLSYQGPDTNMHRMIVPAEVLRPADRDNDKTPDGPFGTPDNKKYYAPPHNQKFYRKGSKKYLLLTFRGKNDLHVGLFPGATKDPVDFGGTYYEFVLGGWNNGKSAIKKGRTAPKNKFVDTRSLVTDEEYRSFWVSADEKTGMVAAGRGHDPEKWEFMSYKDPKPLKVASFAVMTGWGASGEWVFTGPDKANKKMLLKLKAKQAKVWFLGKQGQDCDQTCKAAGRDCDPGIKATFSYQKFREGVKEELGLMCKKDERKWWGRDQPCFVSGNDGNAGKCLAFTGIPNEVPCNGKHHNVMRWCKCSAVKQTKKQ